MGGSSFTHELSLDIKIGCIYALDWKARSKSRAWEARKVSFPN